MGSTLTLDGKDIWNLSASAMARGLWTGVGSVKDLKLSEDSATEEDLYDGVASPALMPDLHLIPGLWKIDGYGKLIKSLKRNFNVTPGKNYFEFPYDWRRDNRAAARRLKRLSDLWLHEARKSAPEAKLILVAHSMGGLVSRYFLECLGGWRDTRALITFGTPYRGSLRALDFIANGWRMKKGPFTLLNLTELVRSFTSVYQLLPIYPCYDEGSGALLRVTEAANLPGLDAKRAADAEFFHEEIKKGVQSHASDPGYWIYPIVGTKQLTLQSAKRNGGALEMLHTYPGEDLDGDGTVPRVSATPIELSDAKRETFAACPHGSLQNDDSVWANIEGFLTGQSLNLQKFQADWPAPISMSLTVEDLYFEGETALFRARPERKAALKASVLNTSTNAAEQVSFEPEEGEWMVAKLDGLSAGSYRITAYGDASVRPTADVFLVV
jgi:hypothetical protein